MVLHLELEIVAKDVVDLELAVRRVAGLAVAHCRPQRTGTGTGFSLELITCALNPEHQTLKQRPDEKN
jgi:hypothetical protein